MIITSVYINKPADLEFNIEVKGHSDYFDHAKLVIEGNEFDILCKCKTKDDTIVASIPMLEGKIAPGVYTAKLEVTIDGKTYTPLKESIEILPIPEFSIFDEVPNTIFEEEKQELVGSTDTAEPATVEAKKDVGAGNAPPMSWEEIVKKSVTNPGHFPIVEPEPYKDFLADNEFPVEEEEVAMPTLDFESGMREVEEEKKKQARIKEERAQKELEIHKKLKEEVKQMAGYVSKISRLHP